MNQREHIFYKRVTRCLTGLKHGFLSCSDVSFGPEVQGYDLGGAFWRVLSPKDIYNPQVVQALADWRDRHQQFFPPQFQVTVAGTRKWLKEQVIELSDRILFFIVSISNAPVAHLGLNRFNWLERSCEIDNVIRGRDDLLPLVMTSAVRHLCDWSFAWLGLREIYLRVLSNNHKAISLYERCGFEVIDKITFEAELCFLRMRCVV